MILKVNKGNHQQTVFYNGTSRPTTSARQWVFNPKISGGLFSCQKSGTLKKPPIEFVDYTAFAKVIRVSGSAAVGGDSVSFDDTINIGQVVTDTDGTVVTTGTAFDDLTDSIKRNSVFSTSLYRKYENVGQPDISSPEVQLIVTLNPFQGWWHYDYADDEFYLNFGISLSFVTSDPGFDTYFASSQEWDSASVNDTTSATVMGLPVALNVTSGLSFSLTATIAERF